MYYSLSSVLGEADTGRSAYPGDIHHAQKEGFRSPISSKHFYNLAVLQRLVP